MMFPALRIAVVFLLAWWFGLMLSPTSARILGPFETLATCQQVQTRAASVAAVTACWESP